MKKRGTIFLCLIVLLFATIGIVACEVEHTHAFTVKSVDERYLASPATCAQPATYYYSCACGEKGTATFTIGNALQHTYSIEWSYNQTEHWHAATCSHNVESDRAAHSYDGSNTCTVCKFNCAKAVTNIFLNKRELSLDVGKEEKLLITVLPLDAEGVTLTWSSTAPSVASVKDGTVTALAKGTAVIIAACGEVSATCSVTVTDPYENFAFSRSGDSYTIKSYLGAGAEVEIPSTYNGKPITAIGNSAFEYCTTLTKVTISDSVTTIGSSAFAGCRSLTNVTIPNSVQTINDQAFEGCISLTNITIPEGITSIGARAFSGCSALTSVVLNAENCEYVYYGIFEDCDNLTTATIGDNVKIIPGIFFSKCTSLTNVTIGTSVTTIGGSAFEECTGLKQVIIPDGVKSIEFGAFSQCSGLTSITIPDSVTSIELAFDGCDNLEGNEYNNALYLGNSNNPYFVLLKAKSTDITSCSVNDKCGFIYDSAFRNCSNLINIQIPNSVLSIGGGVFYGCDNLKYNEYDNALYLGNSSNPYLALVKAKSTYITSCSISEVCKFIVDSAFKECTSLTSISIPDSVVSMGTSSTFNGCINLTSVNIGNNVTVIGFAAFGGCVNLTNVNIGNNVTLIGFYAFNGCSNLTTITIPVSVKVIGMEAFGDCSSLKDIVYNGTMEQWLAVIKVFSWKSGSTTNIHCTDGDIYQP